MGRNSAVGAAHLKLGLAVALGLSGLTTPAAAQAVLGPSKCVSCHDHQRQALKWSKEEPAALRGRAHYNTRKKLEGAKAAAFARAVGLMDPYDVKGSCVRCHATVFRGDAGAGVSCESCHGPGSGYNEPHQVKGAYAKAVAAGMRDLRGKPASIGTLCVDCHVTPDRRLAAAGHPIGATFDAGAALARIVHWTTAYPGAQVSAAGRTAAAPRIAAAGKPGPAPAAAPAGSAPAASAPAGTAAAASAPWDWDQPVRALPADYVPEAEPRAEVPRAQMAAVPPSLAEDLPMAPPPPPPSEGTARPPGTRGAASAVAESRGRAALVLDRLIRAGARAPGLPGPARPREYRGPDGELLRLQDEVLALAVETLRRP
jgi:hypothetical protein